MEGEIAHLLVQTPYVLLLTMVGINVVSAAEFAGEMGPIKHYANAKAITGRAGLFPSRSQSDRVDHAGPLIRCANRNLETSRAAAVGRPSGGRQGGDREPLPPDAIDMPAQRHADRHHREQQRPKPVLQPRT